MYDYTPITWNEEDSGLDVSVYAEGLSEDTENALSFRCYLEYPSQAARDAARDDGRLGSHDGNILIAFGDGQTYNAVYIWPNSDVAGGDLAGTGDFLDTQTIAVPLDVAVAIHPHAFLRLVDDMEREAADRAKYGLTDYASQPDNAFVVEALISLIADVKRELAKRDHEPHLGDGAPRPED